MSQNSTVQPEKNSAAVELGRAGGKARAQVLSPKRRKEIAMSAAIARWSKKDKAKK